MKTLEILGYKRTALGKSATKALRAEGYVPCVLYGYGIENVNFYAPSIMFRDLLYTPDIHKVELNIEGDIYYAFVQAASFHPVNESILHVDFMSINDNRTIKIDLPVRLEGVAVGVQKGGKLVTKIRKLTVKGLAPNFPEYISVNISHLDLGKSVRVSDIKQEGYEILNALNLPIATVDIPRALRSEQEKK